MWNKIPPANTNMNKFESLMNYKGYLERLAQATNVINTQKPKISSIFKKRIKSPNFKCERDLKIQYENRVIFNKLYDISSKYSPYSACLNSPTKCPAYELLSYHRLKKEKIIDKENYKLYKRFAFAKPTLNLDSLDQDYYYKQYLENNISKNKNWLNPNLDFIEFKRFNTRLKTRNPLKLKIKKILKRNIYSNSFENSKVSYENNKDIIIPNLTVNSNHKNNEWFNTAEIKNNINNLKFKEKIKMKRPNSCKPNIIVINREIKEESEIFNSDNLFNSSLKTQRNKLVSSKTGTNGSNSTNIMTSS